MKVPKKKVPVINVTVPEVTREEHIKLIDSLDVDYEYIYLFDCRVRIAIVHDTLHGYYDVLVCGLSGTWFSIDHVNKESVYSAYVSASHAVATAHLENTLDKDLQIIGVKRSGALE